MCDLCSVKKVTVTSNIEPANLDRSTQTSDNGTIRKSTYT